MNVLYEQGLEDVAAQLSGMGYAMHAMRSAVAADAVLYVSDIRAALSATAAKGGAPVLCVRGMSAGEISSCIARRASAALF
ncbi:MAG: YkuS family protein [Clostridia bacterium]|nr:YkuS family protein [Clostridia bacterium]